jgi:hypothetical protein
MKEKQKFYIFLYCSFYFANKKKQKNSFFLLFITFAKTKKEKISFDKKK